MRKQKALKVLNIFMIFLFIFSALSVIIYRWIPSPLSGDENLYYIHIYGGTIFIFAGIIHLILNWSWIKMNYLKRKKGGKQ
jgi:hypothetical protein